jgi:hypothetical protein
LQEIIAVARGKIKNLPVRHRQRPKARMADSYLIDICPIRKREIERIR